MLIPLEASVDYTRQRLINGSIKLHLTQRRHTKFAFRQKSVENGFFAKKTLFLSFYLYYNFVKLIFKDF